MNKNCIYVEWFKSPAQLSRFIHINKIKFKNIISISRRSDDRLEMWFYTKREWRTLTNENTKTEN